MRIVFSDWPVIGHLGVFVEVHTGLSGDVLGADDLTVSLKSLQLEEFGCRQELWRNGRTKQDEGNE